MAELDEVHAAGRPSYDSRFGVRLATQRALQLAIQCCIDIAGHLVADRGATPPASYAACFDILREDGLDRELADRLKLAVGLRNILVHDYLDLDEDLVWASLEHLDDLRSFATFVIGRID